MTERAQAPRRVLITEDVEALAGLMRSLLEAKGFVVDTAPDGEACLRKIPTFQPDLVVLDLMMPKVHGLEIVRVLKAFHRTQSIGIIVCSAKDYKTDRERLRDLGVHDFIAKPFDPAVFVSSVVGFFSPEAAHDRPAAEPSRVQTRASVYRPQPCVKTHLLRLWGTRGSTPVSHPLFLKHGGNTPCLSLQTGDELIVLDAGTGIRELGQWLLRSSIRRVHLFIGHTHWDHIQGFPFFAPAYHPDFELVIYGASGFGKDLKAIFQGQLDRDYFPVQLEDMKSRMTFVTLRDSPVVFGEVSVHWEYVNHPGAAVGFKLEVGGRSVAYITDNEFLEGYTGSPVGLSADHPVVVPYQSVIDFVTGVDVLIHEAQYTAEDYPAKIGWGHSSVPNACVLAKLAGVSKWIVTHHDPAYDDPTLDEKLLLTARILEEMGSPVVVSNAYDGLEIPL